MVGAVHQPDEDAAAEALSCLLLCYQGALSLYVARKFLVSDHDAADLLQGFVLQIVLEKELILKARQQGDRHGMRCLRLGGPFGHPVCFRAGCRIIAPPA